MPAKYIWEEYRSLGEAQARATILRKAGHRKANVLPSMLVSGLPFIVRNDPGLFFEGISVGRPFRPMYKRKRGKKRDTWVAAKS